MSLWIFKIQAVLFILNINIKNFVKKLTIVDWRIIINVDVLNKRGT